MPEQNRRTLKQYGFVSSSEFFDYFIWIKDFDNCQARIDIAYHDGTGGYSGDYQCFGGVNTDTPFKITDEVYVSNDFDDMLDWLDEILERVEEWK